MPLEIRELVVRGQVRGQQSQPSTGGEEPQRRRQNPFLVPEVLERVAEQIDTINRRRKER